VAWAHEQLAVIEREPGRGLASWLVVEGDLASPEPGGAPDTFEAEADRLLRLEARKLADHERNGSRWATFADIEGNEFDLIAK
jgi:hypothetical protein